MPIGLGLASSHAPNMFVPPEKWGIRYEYLTRNKPQPVEAQAETLPVIENYVRRINAGFDELCQRLEAYKPDALIMVSDDQGEIFHPQWGMPSMALFMGDAASGSLGLDFLGDDAPKDWVHLRGHPELATFLAEGLIERDFDLTCVRELNPIGKPDRGLCHGFTRTAPKLMPALDIPVVLIFLNCYFPPLPSARRCLQLGQVVAELLAERPERVAIFGSGGLSHDPGGPRAGWVDQPLDRFLLKALEEGKPERLEGLYTFDSDTLRGGTGEIRNWLVAAGAMGRRKAICVDYIPAHQAVTGLGFAYWPEADGSGAVGDY